MLWLGLGIGLVIGFGIGWSVAGWVFTRSVQRVVAATDPTTRVESTPES